MPRFQTITNSRNGASTQGPVSSSRIQNRIHSLLIWSATKRPAASTVPSRAGDEYLRNAFDMFAPAFEETLADLGYRAPQAIGAYLAAVYGPPAAQLSVLDVGCGTGLAAPHLRPYARRLDGVDLSPAMLVRAQARGLYEELRVGEAMADMHAHSDQYDLAVAADVFVYFGDLAPLCTATAACLRPQGRLIFTLEAMDPGDS